MILRWATTIILAIAAQTVVAEAAARVDLSLRPVPRPVTAEPINIPAPSSTGLLRVDPSVPGVVLSMRPVPRPGSKLDVVRGAPSQSNPLVATTVGRGSFVSLRPVPRPDRPRRSQQSRIVETVQPDNGRQQSVQISRNERAGAICGNRAIRGETIAPIRGSLRGCGVGNPVRVREVDGISLSQPSIMTCETAQALHEWVSEGVRPAIRRLGGGIRELKVAAHYSCRTRNNRTEAKISEHGKGNAIDISGFQLVNGWTISVEEGWNDRVEGNILRRLHGAACGPFGTVLGPASDRHHRDHFHFDVARHRGGRYCR